MSNLTGPSIAIACSDDPYSQVIESMFELEFPGSVGSSDSLLDTLATQVIGSKQHRYGPTPSPEMLVSIRAVLKHSIDSKGPIVLLVPWGGSKQGPYGADIADLMAMRQLSALRERVERHWKWGVSVTLRLEDLTDDLLFQDHAGWKQKTARYSQDIVQLARMFGFWPLLESELMKEGDFKRTAAARAEAIFEAMMAAEASRRTLILGTIGWTGDLPQAQIDHYLKAYRMFYPSDSHEQHLKRIATYFGAAMARKELKGSGAVVPNIVASFTPPIPGVWQPGRVYYRTVPEHFTNQHRSPWIAKGYIRIRGNQATPAIAGFQGDGLAYSKSTIRVSSSDAALYLEADYVVQE